MTSRSLFRRRIASCTGRRTLFSEDMPPEWMWPYDDALEEWFDQVDRRRKDRAGRPDEDEEPDDMMQNQLTKGM
jgi:hypothetical protein